MWFHVYTDKYFGNLFTNYTDRKSYQSKIITYYIKINANNIFNYKVEK